MEKFIAVITSEKFYLPFVYVAIGLVLNMLIGNVVDKIGARHKSISGKDKRKDTVINLAKSVSKYLILIFVVLGIFKLYGVDTTSIIASIGVFAAVIGLAFQDILKDVLAGASIIFDNKYAVGDVVQINGFTGTVIEFGLRTTKIKSFSGEVKSIEMHHETFETAEPGDNIGFNVRGVGKNDIRRGDVAGHVDDAPAVAKEFDAQIVVLQHPGVITVGYTPVFHCHTSQVACTFLELTAKLDPATGQVAEENPDFLKTGNAAFVKVKPTKPMVIENAKKIPQMGRFAIRDMGQTVAAGLCIDVTPAK